MARTQLVEILPGSGERAIGVRWFEDEMIKTVQASEGGGKHKSRSLLCSIDQSRRFCAFISPFSFFLPKIFLFSVATLDSGKNLYCVGRKKEFDKSGKN